MPLAHKSAIRALPILGVALMPLAAAQAVSPLGWEIPETTTSSRAAADEARSEPLGPSPLGFVIPAPGPRGVAGPVHKDSAADTTVSREWNRRLGGIGGTDSN